jgi:HD-GYP domain-containing protein (c-di-GMP phosphodiesterase class II)
VLLATNKSAVLLAGGNSTAIEWDQSAGTSRVNAAWDALDRFLSVLQDGRQVPDEYRATVAAVGEATGADLAFLYSDRTGEVLEVAGTHPWTPQWCRDVCHKLAAEIPRGGGWESPGQSGDGSQPCGTEPFTAVMLPVDVARPAWLVAVSFNGDRPMRSSESRILRVIWRLQVGHNRHALVFDNLKETLFGIIRCLSTAIDAKDPFTSGHSERVARIAVRLGEELKLSRGEISDLYLAGLLHDVGKIGIRDDVLLKNGPLTPEEFTHMKEHTVLGDRIVSNVTRLAYLRPGVRGHHERFDGKGYPDGIAGESIAPMARILAVADSCDAMMSTRRYRAALQPDRIEEIMKEGSGTQWDPRIVEAFFACRDELYAVYQRGLGNSVYMAVERAVGPDPSKNHLAQSISPNK